MIKNSLAVLALACLFAPTLPVVAAEAGTPLKLVSEKVDWPAFMASNDMLWKKPPTDLYDSPLLGNGMLGAYVRKGADNELAWEIGRADVQDHRKGGDTLNNRCRFAVGAFHPEDRRQNHPWLRPAAGPVERRRLLRHGPRRKRCAVKIRSFIPARGADVIVAETATEGGERVEWSWAAHPAVSPRIAHAALKKIEEQQVVAYMKRPNQAAVESEGGGVKFCIQKLDNGETATAWKITREGSVTRLFATIAHTWPDQTAGKAAENALRAALAKNVRALEKTGSAWWHDYYRRTFVSIPDAYWTAFYWAQVYKLAAATRPDGVFLDLQGPWAQTITPWPATWWNLNIQLAYSPCYTGNRLDIADSLRLNLRKYRDELFRNAGREYPDSAAMARASGLQAESYVYPPSDRTPNAELGNLPWTCLLLWRQYRVTMDESILRDDVFPLLRASVNYYLHFAQKGPDGKYHLPSTCSPEYGNTRDCNYDLALLKWGCLTLLKADAILKANDPLAPKWRDVVDNLTDFPVDENGYRIGRDLTLTTSHRHYSHLFMIYPLKLVDVRDPKEKALIEKSVGRWHNLDKGRGLEGYSFTGGASILATLGDGEGAYKFLNGFRWFVRPNTMYKELVRVIETPLSAAESIHDLLLQSSENRIRSSSWRPPRRGTTPCSAIFSPKAGSR